MEHEEERHGPPEKPARPSLVDWLGPGPTVSILLTVGSAVVVGALSVYSMVGSHAGQLADLAQRRDDHEERLREQERRAPRLSPQLEQVARECADLGDKLATCRERVSVIDQRLLGVEREQEPGRLCGRIQVCKGAR